jgi:hypothetical protein
VGKSRQHAQGLAAPTHLAGTAQDAATDQAKVAKQSKADQKAVKFCEFAHGTRAGGANSQNFKRQNEEEGFLLLLRNF